MTRIGSRGRRVAAAVALTLTGVAVGAAVGAPRDGAAASQVAPASTATPTISGTPQVGQTLTAANGSWSGSPTAYAYAWSRCDRNGDACAAIAGATAQTYVAQQADLGGTLRVTVTASNADGSGQATSAPTAVVSSSSAPTNTAPPTISGTVQVGSTLTATSGSWSGASSYAYAWSRCDQTGGSCASISGATSNTYQLKQVDVGTTLRVAVTATNGAGSTASTSVPTAVVPAPSVPAATGCPAGTGAIPIADLTPPARLELGQQAVTPGVITPAATTIQARVRVTACGGRPVQGALVYATAVPYNQYSVPPEATSGADGVATLPMTQLSGFPAARHQQLLVLFLRARKAGEALTGGVSTRLLVSFPVSLQR